MKRGAALAGLIALAAASGAHAQAPCPPAPALTPAPAKPDDGHPSWAKRAVALKAERDWSAPRIAYGACRRGELEVMGASVNALAIQANSIIDEWNLLDRKVRAARAAHSAAMRAYAERRGRPFEEAPAPAATFSGPPCAPIAGSEPAPAPPDPTSAGASDMNRADDGFRHWLVVREDYLACRKTEGAALASAFSAAKTRYSASRKEYAAYRSAFNARVSAFEAELDEYTRALRQQK